MPLLDSKKRTPAFDPRRSAEAVRRATGKTVPKQTEEIRGLQHGVGLLSPQEYYYYRLFDDAQFSSTEKQRFLGRSAQAKILSRCTAHRWRGIVQDKILFQVLMQAYGFTMPRIVATYHSQRSVPGAETLRAAEQLATFLRSGAYPLFGKPVDGMYSLGCVRLQAYDAASDALQLSDCTTVGVAELVAELTPYARRGYLFQEVIHPAQPVHEACGDRIACVRLVILMDHGAPELFRALWKLPARGNDADNFWRPGNMLAALDPVSGRVTRVVRGAGLEQREVERADTGVALIGLQLPYWQRVKELALSGARVLSGLSMQAWDIAVCPAGPVLVEVNVGGDFNLPQLALSRGLLDERFWSFLRRTKYFA